MQRPATSDKSFRAPVAHLRRSMWRSSLAALGVALAGWTRAPAEALSLSMSTTTTTGTRTLIPAAQAAVDQAIRQNHDLASMNALFHPNTDEQAASDVLEVEGALPADLPRGAVLRIGPNPQPGFDAGGFLDGDGMIHAVTLPPDDHGLPRYSRTWVRSQGFTKEEDAGGKQLFRGTLTAPKGYKMLQALVNNAVQGSGQFQKDTANTAVRHHGGKTLALMEQSRPSEVAVGRDATLTTVEAATNLGGAIPADFVTGGFLSAHSKVDPVTGELVSVSYSTLLKPYARHDVFDAAGTLRSSCGIDMPRPIMIHDLAITPKWSIVLDFPMTIDMARTLVDRFPVEFEAGAGSRIGLVAREATGEEAAVKWFEVDTCVVLHTVNAHEREDGNVVLTALRSVPKSPASYICSYTSAFLYQWVLDPQTGKVVSEDYLGAEPCEFPAVNPNVCGLPHRAVFAVGVKTCGGPLTDYSTPEEGILIDALVKLDASTGDVLDKFTCPPGQYVVSEPTVVAKEGAGVGSDEDACYVFMTTSAVKDGERGLSKLHVFDGGNVGAGPVCSITLPGSMPYGLHSCFVPWEDMR